MEGDGGFHSVTEGAEDMLAAGAGETGLDEERDVSAPGPNEKKSTVLDGGLVVEGIVWGVLVGRASRDEDKCDFGGAGFDFGFAIELGTKLVAEAEAESASFAPGIAESAAAPS